MDSRALVLGAIAVGIAIGYIAGFLTYYNALSSTQGVNAEAMLVELDSLKGELEKSNIKLSVISEDNEKLRSTLSQTRADNEVLQRKVDTLQTSLDDPSGSLARIRQGVMLLNAVSGSIPFSDPELTEWRLAVVNDAAALDPALVPAILKLADSWTDVVQLEENEPEVDTRGWDEWNLEWQEKVLAYISAYNDVTSNITTAVSNDIESLKAALRS